MTTKMKCHYEVLGIERDASADDMKKAYRKLALRWHPDKNPDCVDECTAQFRVIQQAYDVLSDPQERAWYDKHREAILRGGMGRGDDYTDDSLDVFQYFNSSCYSSYSDDNEESFYAVYGRVFKQLAEEDYVFMDDKESDYELPEFGNSASSYEEIVKPFYDFWESFQTVKSYVWVEKYDTREAPDRRIRRLMEQENKKLRDAARKERNEEVRALVKFVRKRDKRVQAYKKKLEERAEEIKKKGKENRERQLQERQKMMESYKETEWSAMTELEADMKRLEFDLANQFGDPHHDDETENVDDEEEEEEEYYNDLFCVACNKAFKSDKAFMNHEKSKKHKENVVFLRQQMQEEDSELVGENSIDLKEDDGDVEEEESSGKQKLSKKQKKKRKQQKRAAMEDEDDITDNLSAVNEVEETCTGVENGISSEQNCCSNTDDINENQDLECTETSNCDDNVLIDSVDSKDTSQLNDPKSKQDYKCNVCSATFGTRNKLFDHIKKQGHALRVEEPTNSENISNKKKNKKKGKR